MFWGKYYVSRVCVLLYYSVLTIVLFFSTGGILMCKSGDRAMLAFDVLWNAVWAIFLHAQEDDWAYVPKCAHIGFMLASINAFRNENNRCSKRTKQVDSSGVRDFTE